MFLSVELAPSCLGHLHKPFIYCTSLRRASRLATNKFRSGTVRYDSYGTPRTACTQPAMAERFYVLLEGARGISLVLCCILSLDWTRGGEHAGVAVAHWVPPLWKAQKNAGTSAWTSGPMPSPHGIGLTTSRSTSCTCRHTRLSSDHSASGVKPVSPCTSGLTSPSRPTGRWMPACLSLCRS